MTSCPDLLALDDEGLLRYILGEETLNENLQLHLERCPICQQRLSDYKNEHTLLLSQLYRVECPDATQLSLYCGNMLSREETSAIDEHLTTCLLCSDEASAIRHELTRFMPSSKPEAFSLWQLLQKSRHITARLVVQPHLAPTRQEGPQWPLYYQSPAINLLLDLSYTGNHQIKLVGAFMCDDEEQVRAYDGTAVDLYRLRDNRSSIEMTPTGKPAEQPFLSATVDKLGHFSFAPLQAGHYAILLHLPDTELVVEQVHLE
jgi:hypothetical protein